jgi:hypothetical protein
LFVGVAEERDKKRERNNFVRPAKRKPAHALTPFVGMTEKSRRPRLSGLEGDGRVATSTELGSLPWARLTSTRPTTVTALNMKDKPTRVKVRGVADLSENFLEKTCISSSEERPSALAALIKPAHAGLTLRGFEGFPEFPNPPSCKRLCAQLLLQEVVGPA